MELEFNMPKEKNAIIKVLGVGGGGTNAVNHMYLKGIQGVNFIVCNTDEQHLNDSPVPNKLQLGPMLTNGLGTGADPEVGRKAAEESQVEIKESIANGTKMIFIAAGMGKGTGTGGAPVIAKIAKDLGLLTIGIVTTPFSILGKSSMEKAEKGIEALKENVDSLIVISNDKIKEIYGSRKASEAFAFADDVLYTAAKGISEIITVKGKHNTDFKDVEKVLKNGGVCIMGMGFAEGENRALTCVKSALENPLLNNGDIRGAKNALVNITTSSDNEVGLDELEDILTCIREAAIEDIEIIYGLTIDETYGDEMGVTIVITGFEEGNYTQAGNKRTEEKIEVKKLEPEPNAIIIGNDYSEQNHDYELEEDRINESEDESIMVKVTDPDIEDEAEKRKNLLNSYSMDIENYQPNPLTEELIPIDKPTIINSNGSIIQLPNSKMETGTD